MNTNNYPDTKKNEDRGRRVSLSGKAANAAVKPKEAERKPVMAKEPARSESSKPIAPHTSVETRLETGTAKTPFDDPIKNRTKAPVEAPVDHSNDSPIEKPIETPIVPPVNPPSRNPIQQPISDSFRFPAPSQEPIICAIDHGYGNIKTSNFCFPANVKPCDETFGFNTDVLTYEGKSYSIGIGHKEFRADKILDQDYYILTLAAIGKELARRKLSTAHVVIAAGLPLTWAEEQHERFREYLMQKPHVDFTYMDTDFHVDIQTVFVFRQGIAAVANQLGSFKGTNMLVDIGNGTMNVMNINEKVAIQESCFTEKYGTYQCILLAREMLQRKFGGLPTDAQIERYLRSLNADIGEGYKAVIHETAKKYVAGIFHRLREHEYNPTLMRLWVIGGGGCLLRNFGEYDKERVTFIEDLRANAKGYERMARYELDKQRKKREQHERQ